MQGRVLVGRPERGNSSSNSPCPAGQPAARLYGRKRRESARVVTLGPRSLALLVRGLRSITLLHHFPEGDSSMPRPSSPGHAQRVTSCLRGSPRSRAPSSPACLERGVNVRGRGGPAETRQGGRTLAAHDVERWPAGPPSKDARAAGRPLPQLPSHPFPHSPISPSLTQQHPSSDQKWTPLRSVPPHLALPPAWLPRPIPPADPSALPAELPPQVRQGRVD
jgi:hypothetical protein